jgi:hypothetical protein
MLTCVIATYVALLLGENSIVIDNFVGNLLIGIPFQHYVTI